MFLFKLLKLIFRFGIVASLLLFCRLIVFCSNHKHILLALLSLEFIVLSIYLLLFIVISYYEYELYFSFIFLVFTVCEGALGLAILVRLIRSNGNDYLSSISVLT